MIGSDKQKRCEWRTKYLPRYLYVIYMPWCFHFIIMYGEGIQAVMKALMILHITIIEPFGRNDDIQVIAS